MRYDLFLLLTSLLLSLSNSRVAESQPLLHLTEYDEEDGVPSNHITQLLEDRHGFLWFSTWNGLCRYDGYEFQTFKPEAGDGCQVLTDRIRDIGLRADGKILCRVDEGYYLFNPQTCRFSNYQDKRADARIRQYRQSQSLRGGHGVKWEDAFGTRWTLTADSRLTSLTKEGQLTEHTIDIPMNEATFACADSQGNLWILTSHGICKLTTDMQHTKRIDIDPPTEVKCLFKDRKGRCWMSAKDGTIRIYSVDSGHLTGYLGTDGQLHRNYTRFGAAVYCMFESADGTLWLGSKPDGLFRLQQTAADMFAITRIPTLNTNIYNIAEDRYGRLWLATLGGGLCYTATPHADTPLFKKPSRYPKDHAQRVRFLHVSRGNILMAATTDGLIVAQIEESPDDIHFRLHQREPERATSLSSSAIMDIVETPDGKILLSTESGGINQITSSDLLAEQLDFRHLNVAGHYLPSDIALSMTLMPDNGILVVSGHLVTLLDSMSHSRVLDSRYFNADYRFSDAHPQRLGGERWLFGLTDGAFITSTGEMRRQANMPRIVLTSISFQKGHNNRAAEYLDTLTLQPHERNVTVHFAALSYTSPERISYAFRLMQDNHRGDTSWNHIGHDRSVTLLDLKPGTYSMEVRSTNTDGEWAENIRTLTLVVKPTFWESVWGRMLILFLIATTIGIVIFTLLYIRQIKRERHETLEAYLALLNKPSETPRTAMEEPKPAIPRMNADDDAMIKRVMVFIEQNLSNSDATVGDMAGAAATSRSGLQRKLKQAMGITPQDLLREARIKHACRLLSETDKSVAEVAYACGFTDPKYFSRCFKQSTGKSPSEYKNAS